MSEDRSEFRSKEEARAALLTAMHIRSQPNWYGISLVINSSFCSELAEDPKVLEVVGEVIEEHYSSAMNQLDIQAKLDSLLKAFPGAADYVSSPDLT